MIYDFIDYMELTPDSVEMEKLKETEDELLSIFKNNDAFSMICYEPLECSDGSLISIQAGKTMGSVPQDNVPLKEYTHFEIRIEKEDDVFEYLGSNEDLIFFRTPKEDIYKYIEKHGHLKKWVEKINEEKEMLLNEFSSNNIKNKNRL